MKLLIRYLGVVLVEKELGPGEYVIGRSPDADILLTQDFISRRHGKVYSEGDRWLYQDLREKHPDYEKAPRELTDDAMIELANDIDLLTEPFLYAEDTGVYDIRDLKTMSKRSRVNRRRITQVTVLLLASLAVAATVYGYYLTHRPMDPNALLAFARPMVVELERSRDDKAIRDLKTYAGIQDAELHDSVSFCSGFIVAPEVVLTASHCVHGSAFIDMDVRFKVKTHDEKLHLPLRVLGFDTKRDYAYLEVPGLRGYGTFELTTRHKVGDTVYTIGNVQGQGIAIRDGILASTTQDADRPEIEYLRYSAAASPGNSGGPLVDGFGRVVGIVFARTFAENYNLATAADELIAGKRRFVDDRNPKEVNLHVKKDLDIRGGMILEQLRMPYMSAWGEDPETLRPLDEISTTIEVPVPLAEYPARAVAAFSRVARAAHSELVSQLEEEELEYSWQAHVNEKHRLIPLAPPNQPRDVKKLPNRAIAAAQAGLIMPAGREMYEAYTTALAENESLPYPAETQPMGRDEEVGEEEDEPKNVVTYRNVSYGKFNLMFMARRPAAVMHLDFANEDLARVRNPTYDELLADLTGKEGVEAHTGMSELVRPSARREFIIKRLQEEAEPMAVEDAAGRTWQHYSVPLLGVGNLETFCLPLPQGRLCLHNLTPASNPALTRAARDNRVRYGLSPLIVEPQFWEISALADFFATGTAATRRLMKDFEIEMRASGAVSIGLNTLGVRFAMPAREAPRMVRLNSALFRRSDGSEDWVGTSFEAYFPAQNELCTAGVEPLADDLNTGVFQPEWWEWLTGGGKLGRGEVFLARARSRRLDMPVMVFGMCVNGPEDGVSSGFGSMVSVRPFKVRYTVK